LWCNSASVVEFHFNCSWQLNELPNRALFLTFLTLIRIKKSLCWRAWLCYCSGDPSQQLLSIIIIKWTRSICFSFIHSFILLLRVFALLMLYIKWNCLEATRKACNICIIMIMNNGRNNTMLAFLAPLPSILLYLLFINYSIFTCHPLLLVNILFFFNVNVLFWLIAQIQSSHWVCSMYSI
jgi:hypothetical protein